MIGQVAGVTTRMRVGAGGVMLPNYAPLHVAESFRVLEAPYPERIDLGIGRAPGTDVLAALALRGARGPITADDFPAQLTELLGFLTEGLPDNHRFRKVLASPQGVPAPEIWLLGTSDFSAHLAAELGVGFAFAHHINPRPAEESLRLYREQFRPSVYQDEPRSIIAVSALCAESKARAEALASTHDLFVLRLIQGIRTTYPRVEEAEARLYTPTERDHLPVLRASLIAGTPEQVGTELQALAKRTGVDEVMVTTMTHSHAERRQSYALLVKAFGLPS
jgi:luciferase family oxidoreductase group 1